MEAARSPAMAVTAALALATGAAVVLLLAFPDRTDYAGHFLAGAGGTSLLLAFALPLRRGGAWRVVAVTALAVLAGVGTEATVFRLAEFDPVDLANQSLGAVVAGASFAGADGRRAGAYAAAAGVVLVVAGFRYAFA